MPFLIYRRVADSPPVHEWTGKYFSLAGRNLLYRLWQKSGEPLNEGWHVTASDLVEEWSSGEERWGDVRLLIDYDPRANWRIGLMEPQDIYLFTYDYDGSGKADWTVVMMRLSQVFYQPYEGLSQEDKSRKMSRLQGIKDEGEELIQFTYLRGERAGWNWGATGRTNAALLHEDARRYFRQFF